MAEPDGDAQADGEPSSGRYISRGSERMISLKSNDDDWRAIMGVGMDGGGIVPEEVALVRNHNSWSSRSCMHSCKTS